ncbi:HAD family hydrolase [Patescibacteria group bacterium]|nr:HAD family hydrolase [Patescibacteria group bacterium]
MKIIFDFDHTLFSAKKFYETLKYSLLKLKVDKKSFQKTYQESKSEGKNYRPSRQFELIIKEKPEISLKELEKSFKKVLNQSKQFLYSDVLPFLRKIKKDFDLIIVSYGEEKFQSEKIKKSEVADYFKKFFISKDINKVSIFKKFLKDNEKAVFVDDSPAALSEIKKNFLNITTIRINRGEGKCSKEKNNKNIDFLVKNLRELKKIIYNIK